jgi:hypothetical protein
MPSVGEICAMDCISTPASPIEPVLRFVWTSWTDSGRVLAGMGAAESAIAIWTPPRVTWSSETCAAVPTT